MSCDWDVYCVDCKSHLGISDANHGLHYMETLVEMADAIAGIGRAMDAMAGRGASVDCDMSVGGYRFDQRWFAAHVGHKLAPIDEYGRLSTQCAKWVTCGECKSQHRCTRDDGHEGACAGEEER